MHEVSRVSLPSGNGDEDAARERIQMGYGVSMQPRATWQTARLTARLPPDHRFCLFDVSWVCSPNVVAMDEVPGWGQGVGPGEEGMEGSGSAQLAICIGLDFGSQSWRRFNLPG